ncbi:hypothetical protein BJF79_16560 [Actinomadura sp. CNU-125]|nr:hypothetical protein BJF79_16560 [Actinomadura sp. CNU-125]
MLVVEASGRRGVPRAGDLAGEDLQVRHRVDARAVGEDEVAVQLVGVGALGLGADDDVADPDGVGVRVLQGAAVVDAAAAVRDGVVDQEPVLQVLAAVDEVHPVQLGVAAGRLVRDGRRDPHQVAAQRDVVRDEPGVAAEPGVLVRDVHAAVVPVLQADHREAGAVADDELDVVGVGRRAAVREHDGGLGERLQDHGGVPVGGGRGVLAAHPQDGRRRGHRLLRDGDDRGLRERVPRLRRDPVGRDVRLADAGVVAATVSTVASGAASTSTMTLPPSWAVPLCRPCRRRSGVNRHSSSRPVGTSKSPRSYDAFSCSVERGLTSSPISRRLLPSEVR